jgi:hypothetical protein
MISQNSRRPAQRLKPFSLKRCIKAGRKKANDVLRSKLNQAMSGSGSTCLPTVACCRAGSLFANPRRRPALAESLRFPNLHPRKMTFRPAIDFEVATIVFKLNVNRQLCFGEIIYSEILGKHIFNLTALKIPEDSDTWA